MLPKLLSQHISTQAVEECADNRVITNPLIVDLSYPCAMYPSFRNPTTSFVSPKK